MKLEAPSTLSKMMVEKTDAVESFWRKQDHVVEEMRRQSGSSVTNSVVDGDNAKGFQQTRKYLQPTVSTVSMIAVAAEKHRAMTSFERFVNKNYDVLASAGAAHGIYMSEGGFSGNFIEGDNDNIFAANLDISKLQNPEMYGIKDSVDVVKDILRGDTAEKVTYKTSSAFHVSKMDIRNTNARAYARMSDAIMKSKGYREKDGRILRDHAGRMGMGHLSHFGALRKVQRFGANHDNFFSENEKIAMKAGDKAKHIEAVQRKQMMQRRMLPRRMLRTFVRTVGTEDVRQGYQSLYTMNRITEYTKRFVTKAPGKLWKVPQKGLKFTLNRLEIEEKDLLSGIKNKYVRNATTLLLNENLGNGLLKTMAKHKVQASVLDAADEVLKKLDGSKKAVIFAKDAVNLMKTDVTKAPNSIVKKETKQVIGKLARNAIMPTLGTVSKWKGLGVYKKSKLTISAQRKIARDKVFRPFTKPLKKSLTDLKNKSIKIVKQVIKQAVGLLVKLMAALGPVGLVILIVLFLIFFIIASLTSVVPSVTNIGCSIQSEAEMEANGYNNVDVTKWINHLNETHDEFCDELTPGNFGVDEIHNMLYCNGAKENYREIISAVSVMINYDWSYYKDKEVYELLDEVYYATHQATAKNHGYRTYTTGSGKNAVTTTIYYCDVDVTIKRAMDVVDACIAYTVNDGYMNGETTLNLTDSTWIKICYTAKKALAVAAKEQGKGYDQSGSVPVKVVDGNSEKTYIVRPDCSGYVSFALQLYGALGENEKIDSSSILYTKKLFDGDSAKFNKLEFSSFDELQVGDIYGYPGHIQIYAGKKDGIYYRLNAGFTADVLNEGISKADTSTKNTYIFRPKKTGANEIGESTVSTEKKEQKKASSAKSTATTEKNAINALIKTAKSAGSDKNDGTLEKVTDSWKFIQYVFSRHGATLGNTMTNAFQNLTVVSSDNIQKGDIIIYGDGPSQYVNIWSDSLGYILKSLVSEGDERINPNTNVALVAESPYKAIGYIDKNVGNLGKSGTVDEIIIDKTYVGVALRPTDLTVETADGATLSFGGWTDDTKEIYASYISWDLDDKKFLSDTFWIEESDTTNEGYEDRYVGYTEGSFDGFSPDMSGAGIANLDYSGENRDHVYIYLRECGFNHTQTCGIMGNLWQESRYDPTATNSSGYYGIAQWGGGRKTTLQNGSWLPSSERSGYDYTDIDTQLRYMIDYETFQGHRAGVKTYITNEQSKNDVIYACEAFCVYFEGCSTNSSKAGQLTIRLKNDFASSHYWQDLNTRREMAAKLYDDPSLEKAYQKYLKKNNKN